MNELNRKSFVFYFEWYDSISDLSDAQKIQILEAIISYSKTGIEPEINGVEGMAFRFIKGDLDRDSEKYKKTTVSKSVAGALGNLKRWRHDLYQSVSNKEITLEKALEIAKGRSATSAIADVADVANVAVKDKDKDKDKDKVLLRERERVREKKNEDEVFSEKEFLALWAEVRMKYDKKPTYIQKLNFHEKQKFDEWERIYRKKEFEEAIVGLFKQKNMFESNRLRPDHFLERFETYLDAFRNDTQLYNSSSKSSASKKITFEKNR